MPGHPFRASACNTAFTDPAFASSLLAAYSGRTNRISAEMVFHAAENLELVEERPSRFSWLRRRASVAVPSHLSGQERPGGILRA